jgi:phosphoserine phosphatase
MTLVATLISNPAEPALDTATLARARDALPGATAPIWLDPGIAADIPFTGSGENDNRALTARLREAIGAEPVDVVVQPEDGRRKMLFLADMDSTMIGQECIDELADYAGLKAHVSAITERAMRGEIAFAPALRERVALLKGLPEKVIDEVIAERIRLTPGARALVATLRSHGVHTCLVSGGFTLFTGRVASMCGFHENRANTLLMTNDGKLAGAVAEPILGREAKRDTLLELRERLGLAPDSTMAIGDGANDLDMIHEAGLGVAYRAKPVVAEAARARIDHGDLTAMLYMQGFSGEEFLERVST